MSRSTCDGVLTYWRSGGDGNECECQCRDKAGEPHFEGREDGEMEMALSIDLNAGVEAFIYLRTSMLNRPDYLVPEGKKLVCDLGK